MQAKFALGILLIGGIALGAEYVLVKWYPYYQGYKANKALELLPYQNATLGVDMQVAEGIYGKVEDFPGGVRIYRSHLFSSGPALIITHRPIPIILMSSRPSFWPSGKPLVLTRTFLITGLTIPRSRAATP